jgi:outer membrane protein assembly factor BamD
MRVRKVVPVLLCALMLAGFVPAPPALGQAASQQSQLSAAQRLEVMRSRLDTLRRTLNSAIAGLNSRDNGKQAGADDPRARLSGLEKEVSSVVSEVLDVRGKQERGDRYDPSVLDQLETSVNDIDSRVQVAMRETAGDRRTSADVADVKKKKKSGFFSRILGRGEENKYDELVGTVAPGRDRVLFEEATKEARDDNYETARALYGVVINTYPDSPFLALAKLAIADTFYLEGTTSALIQGAQHYQDWFTFFPTHPLSDDVMLKMAEVEMRRMGLPDREMGPARKAEQRLKAFFQQFPKSSLRPEAEVKLREVQENLAMHNLLVGNHYYEKYNRQAASNLKGAQSRYREIAEKYPHFSRMAEVLYRLGDTYVQEEEPDEAIKYFQRLVRLHPNSGFAEKAKEQLAAMGAQSPEPDATALQTPEPEGVSFFGGIMREITGVVPKTVDKNGVIISTSNKGNDIIDAVIANGGTLPDNYKARPVDRTAPARVVTPVNAPVTKTGGEKPATAPPASTNNVAPSNGGAKP